MMKRLLPTSMARTSLLTIIATIAGVQAASGGELTWHYWSGNGHEYAVDTSQKLQWVDAQAYAENTARCDSNGLFTGSTAYLATSTSQEEENFLIATFGDVGSACWIGGYQDLDDPGYFEPDGAWKWVSGEAWVWTNWKPGQPDNTGGIEHFLAWDNTGWNDQWTRPGYAYAMIERIPDCNGNGIDDPVDIADGTSTDCNGNGIPDECDLDEDVDGDGDVDLSDLAALLARYGQKVYQCIN